MLAKGGITSAVTAQVGQAGHDFCSQALEISVDNKILGADDGWISGVAVIHVACPRDQSRAAAQRFFQRMIGVKDARELDSAGQDDHQERNLNSKF